MGRRDGAACALTAQPVRVTAQSADKHFYRLERLGVPKCIHNVCAVSLLSREPLSCSCALPAVQRPLQ